MGLELAKVVSSLLFPPLFLRVGTLKNPSPSIFLLYVPYVPMFLYINIEIGIYGVYI